MKKTAVLAFSHFTVDLACFTVLFGLLRPALGMGQGLALSFLAYNLLAFGLQAPLGALIDVKKISRESFASLGAAVTALGLAGGYLVRAFALPAGLGIAAMAVTILGNAGFHVGAGSSVLRDCGGKLTPVGLFNCAGALGVGLGTYLGGANPAVAFPLALAAITGASGLSMFLAPSPEGAGGCPELARLPRKLDLAALAAALFASVAVHTCACGLAPTGPALPGALAMLPAVMICLGKLAGGAAADKLGGRDTVLAPLLISGGLFALTGMAPALAIPAIFLMNMSVPVTQAALAGAMPEYPGFAFGLSKLAIALGSAVPFFIPLSENARGPVAGALTALSALAAIFIKKEEPENVQSNTP